jgi:hypothetical protein
MDTGYSRHMTNNTTAVATTTDECLLVECDETARTIRFLDDDDREVAAYAFDTFASVTNGLAIDAGRGVAISDEAVAALQQWADLDAFGLRRRAA